jgi:hypothetical protein
MVNVAAPVATALVCTAGARLGSEVIHDGLHGPVDKLLILLVPIRRLALSVVVTPDPVAHRVWVLERSEQRIDDVAG